MTTSSLCQFGHHPGPDHQALLEPLQTQPGEDVAEGVVGRGAVGQFKEGPEPLHFALVEQFDMEPGVGAVDGNAKAVFRFPSIGGLWPCLAPATSSRIGAGPDGLTGR